MKLQRHIRTFVHRIDLLKMRHSSQRSSAASEFAKAQRAKKSLEKVKAKYRLAKADYKNQAAEIQKKAEDAKKILEKKIYDVSEKNLRLELDIANLLEERNAETEADEMFFPETSIHNNDVSYSFLNGDDVSSVRVSALQELDRQLLPVFGQFFLFVKL